MPPASGARRARRRAGAAARRRGECETRRRCRRGSGPAGRFGRDAAREHPVGLDQRRPGPGLGRATQRERDRQPPERDPGARSRPLWPARAAGQVGASPRPSRRHWSVTGRAAARRDQAVAKRGQGGPRPGPGGTAVGSKPSARVGEPAKAVLRDGRPRRARPRPDGPEPAGQRVASKPGRTSALRRCRDRLHEELSASPPRAGRAHDRIEWFGRPRRRRRAIAASASARRRRWARPPPRSRPGSREAQAALPVHGDARPRRSWASWAGATLRPYLVHQVGEAVRDRRSRFRAQAGLHPQQPGDQPCQVGLRRSALAGRRALARQARPVLDPRQQPGWACGPACNERAGAGNTQIRRATTASGRLASSWHRGRRAGSRRNRAPGAGRRRTAPAWRQRGGVYSSRSAASASADALGPADHRPRGWDARCRRFALGDQPTQSRLESKSTALGEGGERRGSEDSARWHRWYRASCWRWRIAPAGRRPRQEVAGSEHADAAARHRGQSSAPIRAGSRVWASGRERSGPPDRPCPALRVKTGPGRASRQRPPEPAAGSRAVQPACGDQRPARRRRDGASWSAWAWN